MFNLRKLEERIVLDGAAMTDALNEAQEQEEQGLELFRALETHNRANLDYDLDYDEPLYLPDDESAPLRVLAISSDIEDGDDLAAAVLNNVIVVRYDTSDTSETTALDNLAEKISEALNGEKADSIAFATHSHGDGQLKLTETAIFSHDSLGTDEHREFWQGIGDLLTDDGRIDLLTCDMARTEAGELLMGDIAEVTGKGVAASSDATGNPRDGGDWVLENVVDADVDGNAEYFDLERLGQFDGTLNQAPTLDNPLSNDAVSEGEAWTYTVPPDTFSDPDNDVLTYWSLDSKAQLPYWADFDPVTRTFTGTVPLDADRLPGEALDGEDDAEGDYAVTVTVTDPSWAGTQSAFQLTVYDTAEPPLLTDISTEIQTQEATQHQEWTFTIPEGLFIDPDDTANAITYRVGVDGSNNPVMPADMSFDSATRTFTWTPDGPAGSTIEDAVAASPHTVRIEASDPNGDKSILDIEVAVQNVNDTPYLNQDRLDEINAMREPGGALDLDQGETFTFTLPEDLFIEPEGDNLTYWSMESKGHLPEWMSFDQPTRTFTGTVPNDFSESEQLVTVVATDPSFGGSQTSFFLTVNDKNFPPELQGVLDDTTVAQHGSLVYTIPEGTFVDPDPGDTTYYYAQEITEGPANLKIIGEAGQHPFITLDKTTGTLTFTPDDQTTVGTGQVQVWAYDSFGAQSDATTFNFEVTDVNDPPMKINEIEDQYAQQGEAFSFTLPPDIFEDQDGDSLTYWSMHSKGQLPDWLSFDQGTQTFSGIPIDETDVGMSVVTVTATDPSYLGAQASFFLHVADTPDAPPQIADLGDRFLYTEGDGPVRLDINAPAMVTDLDSPDFEGGLLKVTVVNEVPSEDHIGIDHQGDGAGQIGVYDDPGTGPMITYEGVAIGNITTLAPFNGTLEVDLTGNANSESVSALIQNITYENSNLDMPDTNARTIRFEITDGDGSLPSEAQAEVTVDITQVNSAPTIENLSGDLTQYVEGDATPAPLDTDVAALVSDLDSPDFNGGYLEVQVGGYQTGDSISFTAAPIGTVSYPQVNLMKVDFNDGVTASDVQTFIRTLNYESLSDNPSAGDRLITVKISDGDGEPVTLPEPIRVTVQPINDDPIIENINGDTQTFTEAEGGPVLADPVILDTGTLAQVFDEDSPDFDGGRLRVEIISGNQPTEDLLGIYNEGLYSGMIGLSADDVTYGGNRIGMVDIRPDEGILEVVFNNTNATPEAVSALLQNLTYQNTNVDNPIDEDPRIIQITLEDGDGGQTGAGGDHQMTLTVAGTNDTPVLGGIEGDALFYEEGTASPGLILNVDQDASVADVDSPDFDTGYLEVKVISGGDPSQDQFLIEERLGIDAAPSGDITYQNNPIGKAENYGTSDMTINFNANATPEAVSALMKNITYYNSEPISPTPGERTVEFTFYDGDGDNGTSLSEHMTVTVGLRNDAPVIHDIDNPTKPYYEEDAPMRLDADAYVDDIDSEGYDRLTVQIVGGLVDTEDVLTVRNEPGFGPDRIAFDGNDVTYSFKTISNSVFYDPDMGMLQIELNDNADDTSVSKLIQNIVYQNTNSEDPQAGDRTVEFKVWDDQNTQSAPAEMTFTVEGVNDAPEITHLEPDSHIYQEGEGQLVLDKSPVSAGVADVDSTDLGLGRLVVSFDQAGGTYDSSEDVLAVRHQGYEAGQIGYDDDGVVSYGPTQIGQANFDPGSGQFEIDLTSRADIESVAALIQNITYENTDTLNPTEGDRNIQFLLWEDYWESPGTLNPDGGESSQVKDVLVSVNGVNDGPVIYNLGGDTLLYDETEGVRVVDQGTLAVVEDAEGTLAGGRLTVEILGNVSDEDRLSISGGNIGFFNESIITYQGSELGTAEYTPGQPLMKIQLNDGDWVNTSTVSELIQSITYNNLDSWDPTEAERTLRFVVTDGENMSPQYDVTIDVQAPNDDPVIINLDAADTLTYMEDSSPVRLDQPDLILVEDMDSEDFNGGKLTVEILGANTDEDVLGFANDMGVVYNSGALMFNNVQIGENVSADPWRFEIELDEDATPTAVTAALQTLTFENTNTADPQAGARTVRVILTDGEPDEGSTPSTGANEFTVTVEGLNDQPMITGIEGDTALFVENEDTDGVLLDDMTDAMVMDADGTAFSGGHLHVQITDGYESGEDRLTISTTGSISVSGNDVNYGAETIGTVAAFDASAGMLDVTLNGNADASEVSALIQSIAYENNVASDGDPTGGERTIQFSLDDGSGAPNAMSDPYEMTLTVLPANDPPILSGITENAVAYTEGQGAVLLDADTNAAVTDVDSPNFEDGWLRVQILGGEADEDVLSISSGGMFRFDGADGDPVYAKGGIQIGTANFDENIGTLTVNFNANANTGNVSELLQNITYENVEVDALTEGTRTVRFTMGDGDLGNNGGQSEPREMLVDVTGENDPPEIENLSGDTAIFYEDDVPTSALAVLDQPAAALVSDVDSSDFSGGQLVVEIVGGTTDDHLSIRHQGSGGIGFYDNSSVSYQGQLFGKVSFDDVNGLANQEMTITFTDGDADAEAVSALIQNVGFYSANTLNPDEYDRTVRFTLYDGGLASSTAIDTLVSVEDVNDGPQIFNLDTEATYVENSDPITLDANSDIQVWDIDSDDFDGGVLSVQIVGGYENGEDVLGIRDQGAGVGNISVYGNIIQYGDDQIGEGSFNAADGRLDINLFDLEELPNDTEAVAALIEAITYENVDTLHPTGGERTIRFVLDDGDLEHSPDYFMTLNVSSVNNAPVISDLEGDTVGFTEMYTATDGSVIGGEAVLLDQLTAATVSDIDSPNFNGGLLRAEIHAGFDPVDDLLSIQNQGMNIGEIGYSAGDVYYGGVLIGEATFTNEFEISAGRLDVSLNENADSESVSALIQNITYDNINSDDPTEGARQIQVAIFDGYEAEGTDFGGSSAWSNVTVNVDAVNESPQIFNLGESLTYPENGPHGGPGSDIYPFSEESTLLLDKGTDAYVTDVDSTDFGGGWLEAKFLATDTAYFPGEDVLFVSGYTEDGYFFDSKTDPAFSSVSFNDGVLKVDFANGADESDINLLLRHIAYANTLSTTTAHEGERTIRFTLYDGDYTDTSDPAFGTSASYDVTVNVEKGVNSPPQIGGLHHSEITFTEGTGASLASGVLLSGSSAADVTDFDSLDFDRGHLMFRIDQVNATEGYQNDEDRLGISTVGGVIGYDDLTDEVTYNGTVIGTTPGFNSASGILDITLNENANETTVGALINSISYQNINTGNPLEGYRTIRFGLSDGDDGFAPTDGFFNPAGPGDNGSYLMSVLVSGTNDAPEILNIEDSITFYEADNFSNEAIDIDTDRAATAIDVDDTDWSGGSLTITVAQEDGTGPSGGEDWLTIADKNGVTFVEDSNMATGGDYTGAIIYDSSQIGTAGWRAAEGKLTIDWSSDAYNDGVSSVLESIQYSNTNTYNPEPGNRTVRFMLDDGDGGTSEAVLATVNVVGVNDAPEFHSWETDNVDLADPAVVGPLSQTYLEDDGYAVRLQPGAGVRDLDIAWPPYNNFDGGVLTIEFDTTGGNTYVNTEDVLSVANGGGITMLDDMVLYGGKQLGTLSYDKANGELRVDITSDDSTVSNTDGVSQLLQNVTYHNTNTDNPTEGMRSVRFTFSDGDGGVTDGMAFDGDDGTTPVSASMSFHVSGVNDAPVIDNLAGDVATFLEGGDPVSLDFDSNATVADVDSLGNNPNGTQGAWLTVDIEGGHYSNQDVLTISDNQGLSVDTSTGNISYGGTSMGDYTWDQASGLLQVTLSNGATMSEENISLLLRSIVYDNTSANPTNGMRTVRWSLVDGDGTDFGGKDSAGFIDTYINVGGVNDGPDIYNIGDPVEWTEPFSGDTNGAAPVFLDSTTLSGPAFVSDQDSTTFDGGRLEVTITDGYHEGEDRLLIPEEASDLNDIWLEGNVVKYDGSDLGTYTWDQIGGQLTVNLSGPAAEGDAGVSALVQSIAYDNLNSDDPTEGERSIRFQMWDDAGDSSLEYNSTSVNVVPLNDIPVINMLSGSTVTFREGLDTETGVLVDQSQDAWVEDVDSEYFNELKVWTQSNGAVGDVLSIRHMGMLLNQVGFDGNVSGGNVSYEGEKIGTAVSTESVTGATLTVNFDPDKADAEAVSAVIQSVTFNNEDDIVAGVNDHERKLHFTVTDSGDGNSGSGSAASSSAVASSGVNVEAMNTAPIINALAGQFDYAEANDPAADSAVMLSNKVGTGATLIDNDSADIEDGKLDVKILGGDSDEDVLIVDDTTGTISVMTSEGAQEGDVDGVVYDSSSNPFATYSWDQDAGRMQFDFNSNATITSGDDAVDLLLRSIAYYNKDVDNPMEGERTIRFAAWDGDPEGEGPGASSEYSYVTVDVNRVNDGPVINDIDGDSVEYVEEGAPVLVDQQAGIMYDLSTGASPAFVSDIDSLNFDGGVLKAWIANFADGNKTDVIGIRNQGPGADEIGYDGFNVTYEGTPIGDATYQEGTGKLDVNLYETANTDAVTALIQNITYSNTETGALEDGERTIRFTLSDGDGSVSAESQSTIMVKGVNDAPVIHDLDGDVVTFTEVSANYTDEAVLLDKDVDAYVTDADERTDFGGGNLHIQITAGGVTAEDVLGVFNMTTGGTSVAFTDVSPGGFDEAYTAVFNYANLPYGTVSWSGEDGRLDVHFNSSGNMPGEDALSALLKAVAYTNMGNDSPTEGDRVVRVWMDDGDGNAYGGESVSEFYHTTVQVRSVNDAPEITSTDPYEEYYENNSAAALLIDRNMSVSDVDSSDFDGGRLVAQIVGGLEEAEDVLGIANHGYLEPSVVNDGEGGAKSWPDGGDTAPGLIEVIEHNVYYDDKEIGQFDYVPDTGLLTVTLTENADTETVSALIQNITYANTDSDNPTEGERTIRFRLFDGDGGDEVSEPVEATVYVSRVNDAPEIFELDEDIVTFKEDEGAVTLDLGSDAWVRDVDNDNFNGGWLVVDVDSPDSGDEIGVRSQGAEWDQIEVDTGDVISYGSIISYGGTPFAEVAKVSTGFLYMDLNTDATDEAVTALIQNITFNNTEDNLSGEDRTVQFRLSDGTASSSAEVKVLVETTNDAPEILNVDGSTGIYYEDDGAEFLSELGFTDTAWVGDGDSTDFLGGHLKVQITNPDPSEDMLWATSDVNITIDGNQVILDGSLIGTMEFEAGKGLLDVALTHNANSGNVDDLIQAITYENTNTADPNETDRNIRFTLSDGDGATSDAVFMTLQVSGVNDAPTLSNIEGDSVTFTEGDEYVLLDEDGDGLASDPDGTDFAGGQLVIEIEDALTGEDMLSIRNEGDGAGQIAYLEGANAVFYGSEQIGTVVSDDTTLTVNFFDSPVVSTEAVSALIQNITYTNIDTVNPTPGDFTVRFTLYDSEDASSFQEMIVGVDAVNTGPTIHELEGDFVTYTEGSTGVFIDKDDSSDSRYNAAYVSDLDSTDFDGGHLYVQIVENYQGGDEDMLSLPTASGGDIEFAGFSGGDVTYTATGDTIGTATWNKATGLLDVALNADADTDAVSALIQSVTYENLITDNVTEGDRSVRFVLWDGGDGPTSIGASSNYSFATVTVEGVNDPPQFHNMDASSAYTEGDPPVLLDAETDNYLTDADSSDFDGGWLVVDLDGPNATDGQDVLSIRNQGPDPGKIGYTSGDVTYGGVKIGDGAYNPGDGILKVNFNERATTESVSALIQNITYENLNTTDPEPGNRTIRFIVSDGDMGNDDGTVASDDMILYFSEVNSPPEIINLAGDTHLYEEGTGAWQLSLDKPPLMAKVSDEDSDNFNGGHLTVQIVEGFAPDTDAMPDQDVLGIRDAGDGARQISVSGSNVEYEGNAIGTFTYDAEDSHTLRVGFNNSGYADDEAVAALIQHITYENSDTKDPYPGDRVIRFLLTDGESTPATSVPYDVTVSVAGVNDAPVITGIDAYDSFIFYEADGSPTSAHVIDMDVNGEVTDEDNADFGGGKLTVQIVEGFDRDEDDLWIRNEGNGARQIGIDLTDTVRYGNVPIGDADFDMSAGLLTVDLNEDADSEAVSSLIQNVTYNNLDSDNPTEGDRLVRFVLWDGAEGGVGLSSDAVDTTINVRGVNDKPEIMHLEGPSLTYVEGDAPLPLDLNADAMVKDVDTTSFHGGWLVVDFENPDLDAVSDGVHYDDQLGIQSQEGGISLLDPDYVSEGTYSSLVMYNGVKIGIADFLCEEDARVGDTFVGASGNPGLTVEFYKDADSEAVSALIQSITYMNGNTVAPVEGDRTIRFKLMDGDDPTDRPWIEEATSDWYQVTVNVQGLNDAPVIENLAGDSMEWGKTDGLTVLDQGEAAVVSDPDNDDFNGGQLTVTIENDRPEDTLGIDTSAAGISLVGNDVYYDSKKIGSYGLSSDGDQLTVDFNTANADHTAVEAMIQSVGYDNDRIGTFSPTAGERTISFVLDDGQPDGRSENYAVTVQVNANRPPELAEEIQDRVVAVDQLDRWSIAKYFTDPDDTTLSFTAVHVMGEDDPTPVGEEGKEGDLPSWLRLNSNGTFTARPDSDDYQTAPEAYVQVFASDNVQGADQAADIFKISMVQQDVNHAPFFVEIDAEGNKILDNDGLSIVDPNVSFTISEHAESGLELRSTDDRKVMVLGDDVDDGDAATLKYRIIGGTGGGTFTINENTGEIRVGTDRELLDFETGPKVLDLNVQVTDSGGEVGYGMVTIFIQDDNDAPVPNPDGIAEQVISIDEWWEADLEADLHAFTDPDQNKLTYTATLDNGDPLPDWMGLTKTILDAWPPTTVESNTVYTIRLEANDGLQEDGTEPSITFDIRIVASLDHGLRDALRYLDEMDGDYFLPADGEDMEMSEMVVADAAPMAAEPSVDAEMLEALSLLDMAMVDEPTPEREEAVSAHQEDAVGPVGNRSSHA